MYYLATMAQYLPMDKHPVEKRTQWRSVLLKLKLLTLSILLALKLECA